MKNTIFYISIHVIKVAKNLIFQKSLTSHEINLIYCFGLFHSQQPKPKRNHQTASSRAKTKSRRSQICVKCRGIIISIKRNIDVNTSDLKILHTQNVQIRLIFQMLSLISPNFHVVCLQPNA